MKTITRTERIGEKTGPIDWGYDFASHGWDKGGCMNPICLKDSIEKLRKIEHGEWEATTDGGVPRCGWGKVLDTGMYDGWPYWEPTPSFLLSSWTGNSNWHSVFSLIDIRPLRPKDSTSRHGKGGADGK